MDYYSILGVNKGATQDDIKKAYRKLAMAHHPDRGGDHNKFAEINSAYDTLSDPAKRQQYDNPQHRFNSSHMHGAGNFQDIFNNMFGGGFGNPQQQRRKNSDIRIQVDISIKEIFTGKKIIASYRLRSGREQTVDLDIPVGAGDNDTIRFQGLGDDSFPVTRGDLYVIINVQDQVGWTRNQDSLITTKKVNCLELILGTKIQIETVDDKTLELNIPAGTKNGTTFSMQNYGLPNIRTKRRGNMLVKIEAEIPKNLTHEQLSKISEILYGT